MFAMVTINSDQGRNWEGSSWHEIPNNVTVKLQLRYDAAQIGPDLDLKVNFFLYSVLNRVVQSFYITLGN